MGSAELRKREGSLLSLALSLGRFNPMHDGEITGLTPILLLYLAVDGQILVQYRVAASLHYSIKPKLLLEHAHVLIPFEPVDGLYRVHLIEAPSIAEHPHAFGQPIYGLVLCIL